MLCTQLPRYTQDNVSVLDASVIMRDAFEYLIDLWMDI